MFFTSGKTRPHVQAALDFCKSVMLESGIDAERMFIGYCVYPRACSSRWGHMVAMDGILWLSLPGYLVPQFSSAIK